ncbi:MAG: hypothetical protein K9N51_04825 [Candidatus Pacebacteria bacterium]|nr:hypothetical protein [Candidatus Paceibacterota bacterium]
MTTPIHIVEPTLRDETGHCFSHVRSLAEANVQLGLPLHVWAGEEAALLFAGASAIDLHPYFRRMSKRFQTLWLYRRLLRSPGRIYVMTASRTDVMMLDWAAKGCIPPGKVYLLFHWLKLNERKRAQMRKLAHRQPHIHTLAPTEGVCSVLRSCGFADAQTVPYPITPYVPSVAGESELSAFHHILYAGAARVDKGFPLVVSVVEYLAARQADVPVLIQASPPHKGIHEPGVEQALKKLSDVDYPFLDLRTDTMDSQQYRGLFAGAICLQLYDPIDYAADRISGVTLDAFSSGSPILATAGTWMARVVERFDAGMSIDDLAPSTVVAAVENIRRDFPAYRGHALTAGRTLQKENDASHLLRILADEHTQK